ncbi:hypothetical protein SB781_31355, partial [Paraburkholderia sp. SIMBA_061]
LDGGNDKSIDKKSGIDEQCHDTQHQSTDNQRIEDLEARIKALENNQANLADRTWGLENSALTKLDYLQGLSCPLPDDDNFPVTKKDEAKNDECKSTDNSSGKSVKDDPNSLTGAALGKRLGGVSSTAIKKQWKKGEEKFKQWSQERDPDGKAWSYDPSIGKWGKYYPIS